MDLTATHLDLLRVVAELEEPGRPPGSKVVGERLLELWKERGDPYSWSASAPWHGTDPYADELRSAGLLDLASEWRTSDDGTNPLRSFSSTGWGSPTRAERRSATRPRPESPVLEHVGVHVHERVSGTISERRSGLGRVLGRSEPVRPHPVVTNGTRVFLVRTSVYGSSLRWSGAGTRGAASVNASRLGRRRHGGTQ